MIQSFVALLLASFIMMSDDFTFKEYIHSDTANRLGISNVPDAEQVARAKQLFMKVVQPIRDKYGPVQITSGFRNKKLNDAVGGVSDSQHITGEAVDLKINVVDHYQVCQWIQNNLIFDQLILEPGWIHVSYSTVKNRRETLTVKQGVTYSGLIR